MVSSGIIYYIYNIWYWREHISMSIFQTYASQYSILKDFKII